MSELFKVSDSLMISNARAACKTDLLIEEGVTCCINISRRQPFPDLDVHTLRIPVFDHPLQKLSDYFDQCVELIDSTIKSGGKCLVYCKHGRSRSATICIAYLIKHRNMSLKDAFQLYVVKLAMRSYSSVPPEQKLCVQWMLLEEDIQASLFISLTCAEPPCKVTFLSIFRVVTSREDSEQRKQEVEGIGIAGAAARVWCSEQEAEKTILKGQLLRLSRCQVILREEGFILA